MKKLLSIILALVMILSMAACSNEEPKETVDKIQIKEDTKNDNSQNFYLILNGTNEESITYHTEKCPLLKDKEIQKTSWEMIKMLEFRHCSKCNPPKYEGYVE